jgi:hypothetical protein
VNPSGIGEVEAHSTDETDSGSGSEESEETGTDDAAIAPRYGAGKGSSWGQIGGIGRVLAVSVLAGMAMVLPW